VTAKKRKKRKCFWERGEGKEENARARPIVVPHLLPCSHLTSSRRRKKRIKRQRVHQEEKERASEGSRHQGREEILEERTKTGCGLAPPRGLSSPHWLLEEEKGEGKKKGGRSTSGGPRRASFPYSVLHGQNWSEKKRREGEKGSISERRKKGKEKEKAPADQFFSPSSSALRVVKARRAKNREKKGEEERVPERKRKKKERHEGRKRAER